MTFDLQKVLDSKRALRRELAACPIAQKLRMLDALRERALVLRRARELPEPGGALRNDADAYGDTGTSE